MAAKKSRPLTKRAAISKSRASSAKKRGATRSIPEIGALDLEAIAAVERFAHYARVALTTLRESDAAAAAQLVRVRSSYEAIYGHPVALMIIVRDAKSIIDAVTLHRHPHHQARSRSIDLEGVPSWVTPKAFARLVASIGTGKTAARDIVAGVVRLVHGRSPHPGAKRLRAEHLAQT